VCDSWPAAQAVERYPAPTLLRPLCQYKALLVLLDRGGGELSTDMSPAVAGGGGEARTGRLKAAIDGDDRSRRGNEMASDM